MPSPRVTAVQRRAPRRPDAPRLHCAARLLGTMVLATLLCLPAARLPRAEEHPGERGPGGLLEPLPLGPFDASVFPIAIYSPETRAGLGAGAWLIRRSQAILPAPRPDNVWMSAVYTQERQTVLRLIPELFFARDTFGLKAHLSYLDFPTRFYGIGNTAPEEARESYSAVTRSARISLTGTVVAALSAGLLADYVQTDLVAVEPGGALATGTVPGSEGSELGALGLTARWDSREHHFNPRSGVYAELSALRYRDLRGEAYAFTRTDADLRAFWPVTERQVLAVQAVAQSVSDEAPFTALPRLGGKELLRGLFEGRFRDRHLRALQAEHRINLGARWGATVFVGLGQVAARREDFSHHDVKTAGGAGLRYAFNVPARINLRLDVAAGESATGVYFSVGEAF